MVIRISTKFQFAPLIERLNARCNGWKRQNSVQFLSNYFINFATDGHLNEHVCPISPNNVFSIVSQSD